MYLVFIFQPTIITKINMSPKEQNHLTLYIVRESDERVSQTNDHDSRETQQSAAHTFAVPESPIWIKVAC